MATTTTTTYTLPNGKTVSAADLASTLNKPGQSVSIGGANPYLGVDLASIQAQEALAAQQFAASQFGYAINTAQRDQLGSDQALSQAQYDAQMLGLPVNDAQRHQIDLDRVTSQATFDAQMLGLPVNDARRAALGQDRTLAQAQYEAQMLGLPALDAQGRVNDLNFAEAQAQYNAQGLQLPVAQLGRDTTRMQADQSVASADANATTALSANEAQRMGLANSERQRQRDMQAITPSIAAGYRGSQYVDPSAVAKREDVGAELGILGQQQSVANNQDAQVNLSRRQAGESAGLARQSADAQYAARFADIGLRDQRLSVQRGVRDQQAAQMAAQRANINLATPELAARNAGFDTQERSLAQDRAQINLAIPEFAARNGAFDTRRLSLDQDRAQINLATPQLAARNAGFKTQSASLDQALANLGLNQFEYDSRMAALRAQQMRVTNPVQQQNQGYQQPNNPTYGGGSGYPAGTDIGYSAPVTSWGGGTNINGQGPLGQMQFGGYDTYGQGPLGQGIFNQYEGGWF